ncbi:hypothetical protein ACI2KR_27230 [Pseudomonas luteola]
MPQSPSSFEEATLPNRTFSDFIRNATDEERAEVYEIVSRLATQRQQALLETSVASEAAK